MKKTLSTYEVAELLLADEYANWSYDGAKALAEYFEEYEEETGTEIEFDRVAIRCDYNEYDSLEDVLADYSKADIDELREYTEVIEVSNGHIIIRAF